jgi:hypothetical protein
MTSTTTSTIARSRAQWRRTGRRFVFAALLSFGVARTTPASADEPRRILAEQLFSEAHALMERGEMAPACGKLEESQKLDPAGGTALLLGICYERLGKHASAWATLRSARALATRDGRQDRIDVATEMLAQVEPRLAYVKLSISPEASAPALRVLFDDVEVVPSSLDVPIPVDPGAHVVRATRAGYAAFTQTLTVTDAPGTTTASIPPLALLAPPATPAPERREAGNGRVVAAATVGAVGTLALGTAVVFGIAAVNAEKDKPGTCAAGDTTCAGQWSSAEDRRSTDATLATLTGGVALAAAVTVVVLLVWPSHGESHAGQAAVFPTPSRDGAGVTVSF